MSKDAIKLNMLKKLGVNTDDFPKEYAQYIYKFMSGNGLGSTYEVGFILPENTELLKTVIKHFHPIKVVTSKPELLAMNKLTGDEHIGFTHINGYWEDNIFCLMYSIPIKMALDALKKDR